MIESVKPPADILFFFFLEYYTLPYWSGNAWLRRLMGPLGSEQSCLVPAAGSVRVTGPMPLPQGWKKCVVAGDLSLSPLPEGLPDR